MSFLIDNFLNFLFYLDSGWGIVSFVFFYIISVLLILPASWLSLLAGYLLSLIHIPSPRDPT